VFGALRPFKKQRSIICSLSAIHDDGIEVAAHQFLNRGRRVQCRKLLRVQLAENLRYGASRLLIRTEEECLVTHIDFIEVHR